MYAYKCDKQVSSVPGNLNVEVIPSSGPIPGGGEVQLEIRVCPTVVGSFDVKMCIYLREGKQLCMRLAGTVEQPKISVEQVCTSVIDAVNKY